MNQVITRGIVLTRTNYQEADRIITLLTPDHGKVRVLAKGVRKSKSKLAGGIELFSIAEIGFIRGRGELATLTSSRLVVHYGNIVKHIDRTMLGYELIKQLHRATEDDTEQAYFDLTHELFTALEQATIPLDVVRFWFYTQMLSQTGHAPNLHRDVSGKPLQPDTNYMFGYEDMTFTSHPNGVFRADDIKFLRLAFAGNKPAVLAQVAGSKELTSRNVQLVQSMIPRYIR